jgi:hypothetical protein
VSPRERLDDDRSCTGIERIVGEKSVELDEQVDIQQLEAIRQGGSLEAIHGEGACDERRRVRARLLRIVRERMEHERALVVGVRPERTARR